MSDSKKFHDLIFKPQALIDQEKIDSSASPDDDGFVDVAERIKSYFEKNDVEIRYAIINGYSLSYELNVDFSVVPRPWLAEMLVVAWRTLEKVKIDPAQVPPYDPAETRPPMRERIRLIFNPVLQIEHSTTNMDQLLQVLASVRDSLLAQHEELYPRPVPTTN